MSGLNMTEAELQAIMKRSGGYFIDANTVGFGRSIAPTSPVVTKQVYKADPRIDAAYRAAQRPTVEDMPITVYRPNIFQRFVDAVLQFIGICLVLLIGSGILYLYIVYFMR